MMGRLNWLIIFGNYDGLVKNQYSAIPSFQYILDSRLRGNDDPGDFYEFINYDSYQNSGQTQ